MIILSILIFIVAMAIPSINRHLSSILFTRMGTIILIFSGALALNAFYIQSIGSGIGVFSGLFQVATLTQAIGLGLHFINNWCINDLNLNFLLVPSNLITGFDLNLFFSPLIFIRKINLKKSSILSMVSIIFISLIFFIFILNFSLGPKGAGCLTTLISFTLSFFIFNKFQLSDNKILSFLQTVIIYLFIFIINFLILILLVVYLDIIPTAYCAGPEITSINDSSFNLGSCYNNKFILKYSSIENSLCLIIRPNYQISVYTENLIENIKLDRLSSIIDKIREDIYNYRCNLLYIKTYKIYNSPVGLFFLNNKDLEIFNKTWETDEQILLSYIDKKFNFKIAVKILKYNPQYGNYIYYSANLFEEITYKKYSVINGITYTNSYNEWEHKLNYNWADEIKYDFKINKEEILMNKEKFVINLLNWKPRFFYLPDILCNNSNKYLKYFNYKEILLITPLLLTNFDFNKDTAKLANNFLKYNILENKLENKDRDINRIYFKLGLYGHKLKYKIIFDYKNQNKKIIDKREFKNYIECDLFNFKNSLKIPLELFRKEDGGPQPLTSLKKILHRRITAYLSNSDFDLTSSFFFVSYGSIKNQKLILLHFNHKRGLIDNYKIFPYYDYKDIHDNTNLITDLKREVKIFILETLSMKHLNIVKFDYNNINGCYFKDYNSSYYFRMSLNVLKPNNFKSPNKKDTTINIFRYFYESNEELIYSCDFFEFYFKKIENSLKDFIFVFEDTLKKDENTNIEIIITNFNKLVTSRHKNIFKSLINQY